MGGARVHPHHDTHRKIVGADAQSEASSVTTRWRKLKGGVAIITVSHRENGPAIIQAPTLDNSQTSHSAGLSTFASSQLPRRGAPDSPESCPSSTMDFISIDEGDFVDSAENSFTVSINGGAQDLSRHATTSTFKVGEKRSSSRLPPVKTNIWMDSNAEEL
jgi:hypothetical protein